MVAISCTRVNMARGQPQRVATCHHRPTVRRRRELAARVVSLGGSEFVAAGRTCDHPMAKPTTARLRTSPSCSRLVQIVPNSSSSGACTQRHRDLGWPRQSVFNPRYAIARDPEARSPSIFSQPACFRPLFARSLWTPFTAGRKGHTQAAVVGDDGATDCLGDA